MLALYKRESASIYTLELAGERIETTREHPFWVTGQGWTEAQDLRKGDEVQTMGGDTQPVTSIEVDYTPTTVYNFTVDGNHNYYVSEDGFLVHNCGKRSGEFLKRDAVTNRHVEKLTGKTPDEVGDYLRKKGWTSSHPQARSPQKIQHTVFTRKTKHGAEDTLDYHPGGGVHVGAYWKVYRKAKGQTKVYGRIAADNFENFDDIVDSPVYVNGIIKN